MEKRLKGIMTMRRTLAIIMSVCLVLSVFSVGIVSAQGIVTKSTSTEPTTFIVELDGNAVLGTDYAKNQGNSFLKTSKAQSVLGSINSTQSAAANQISRATGKSIDVKYHYTHAFNGIAFEATKGDIDEIKSVPGVKNVYETQTLHFENDVVANAVDEKFPSGEMINLNEVRAEGYDGKGTAVAVIDGGLYYNHDAMQLSDDSTAKYSYNDIVSIVNSKTMNSDKIVADEVYKSAKVPFAFDYAEENADVDIDNVYGDEGSADHGTHVSGIIAGNNDIICGVAPEAQILMFKIDVYSTQIFLDTLLAAIDDAAKFEISAMNMSVGMDYEMKNNPEYAPLVSAIDTAREAGIAVCCSAGNSDGGNSVEYMDYSTSGIPNALDGATSVASADNNAVSFFNDMIKLPDGTAILPLFFENVAPRKNNSIAYVDVDPECRNGIEGYDLNGKIALIGYKSGSTGRLSASKFAELFEWLNTQSGAVAIIYDEEYYWLMSEVVDFYIYDTPFVIIEHEDYIAMRDKTDKRVLFDNIEEDTNLSYYTSWGVTDSLEMSVDVTAPGGDIYSSVGGGYEYYSGTSMASPHMAGASALLDQRITRDFPTYSGWAKSALSENIMMSTASVIYNDDGAAQSPIIQGAGMLDLLGAVKTNAILKNKDGHTSINLYDKLGSTLNFSFFAENISDKAVSFDSVKLDVITDVAEEFEDNEAYVSYYTGVKALSFDADTTADNGITIQPHSSQKVTVTINLDEQELAENLNVFINGFYISGFVTLDDSTGNNVELSIPFMGYYGDWLDVPAFYENGDYSGFGDILCARGLKKLTVEWLDDNQNVLLSDTYDYVCKYSEFSPFNYDGENADKYADMPDGTYTIRYTGILDYPGAEQRPQVATREYEYDTTPPDVISIEEHKDIYGIRYLELISSCKEIACIDVRGRTLFNMFYYSEQYFMDGGEMNEDGNYVYRMDIDKKLKNLEVNVYDESYNCTIINERSRFVEFIYSIFFTIKNWLSPEYGY